MAIKDGNKRITVTCTSETVKELEWLCNNVYGKSKTRTLVDMIHSEYVFRSQEWGKRKGGAVRGK